MGGTDGVGVGSRVGRVDGAGLGLVVGTILGVEDGFAVGRFVGTPLGAMLGMAVDFKTQPDSRLACASTPPLELFNQHTPLYGLAVPYVQNLPRTDATAASQSASHHILAAGLDGASGTHLHPTVCVHITQQAAAFPIPAQYQCQLDNPR